MQSGVAKGRAGRIAALPGVAVFQRRGAPATLELRPVKDIAATATLVLSFAAWVTTHVALAARLALRSQPRWRGLVALVVPPLAPMYGFRLGWRRTSTAGGSYGSSFTCSARLVARA